MRRYERASNHADFKSSRGGLVQTARRRSRRHRYARPSAPPRPRAQVRTSKLEKLDLMRRNQLTTSGSPVTRSKSARNARKAANFPRSRLRGRVSDFILIEMPV